MARSSHIQVRVSPEEKQTIRRNAQRAGYHDVGPFMRDRALAGASAGRPVQTSPSHGVVTPAPALVPGAKPSANVDAEVAEAALADDPARKAFIERRTQELYGQGKTTSVARALATAEWEAR